MPEDEPEVWTAEKQLIRNKADYEKLVDDTVRGAAMQIFWAANGLLDYAKGLELPRNYAYAAIVAAIEKKDASWGETSLAMMAFSGQGFEAFKKDAEGSEDWGWFGSEPALKRDALEPTAPLENCAFCGRPLYHLPSRECICVESTTPDFFRPSPS